MVADDSRNQRISAHAHPHKEKQQQAAAHEDEDEEKEEEQQEEEKEEEERRRANLLTNLDCIHSHTPHTRMRLTRKSTLHSSE